MKAALQRLQDAGVAPLTAMPIDYNSAATPGNVLGTGLLMITDEALYFGKNGSLFGHFRIPFDDIGQTVVRRDRNAANYIVIDKTGREVVNLYVRAARKSFIEKFERLGTK